MRWSTVLGVLAGILVVAVAVAAFVASLPAREPVPAPPPIAVGGSLSPGPGPSATPSPLPSTPAPSPSSTATPAGSGSPSPTADESPDVGLKIGDKAPALSLDGLGGDGALVDTSVLKGKPVWVNFMGSYCPPCREELPLMQRIQDQLGEDVVILLVDVKEDEATIQDFVTSLAVALPVGLDRDGATADRWRAFALPIHFWLDAQGKIRGVVYGGAPPDVLLQGLRTVLPKASFEP